MESLSYAFEGKGLFSPDDTNLPIDNLARNRNLLQKWDEVENIGFISNQFLENSVCTKKSNDENSSFPRETNGKRFSIGNSALSSPMPAKKARVSNLQSQIPSCQVYGCNKDLSDAKDYHKRHKVCDAHSKASLVIVKGIQQRFCQQCSRFHVVAEFDEGKRSCRKRLAGHNERRRKPQFDTHFDSTFFRTDLSSTTSLFFSKILPGGFFAPQYNEPTNHTINMRFEEKQSQISQLATKFLQNRRPLSVQDLSSGSSSSCALSLLSAESHNLLPNSAGVSICTDQISSENLITPSGNRKNQMGNGIKWESKDSFKICTDQISSDNGISKESNGLTLKESMSRESANTVDLVELSLHLQRVEQQKRNARVKMENGNVCDSTTINIC